MKKKLQELFKELKNETVFIVGGGVSIRDVDFNDLKGKKVITINNAYKDVIDATALYWCDSSWINKHIEGIQKHPCKLRFQGRYQAMEDSEEINGMGDATILPIVNDFGLTTNPNQLVGNNSGAHVLNLCINMKAKNIILLGYDMKASETRETHYHGGHGYGHRPHIYPELFIPCLVSMAKK
jgi:hypothetical protein